jgi:hypothetical protein
MSCDCNVNLCINQGADWAALVTVQKSDGTNADLTGYQAQAQIREGPADQDWLVAATIQCTVALPNFVSLFIANVNTSQLSGIYYCWDLQLVSPTNLVSTILRGDVNVTPQVTRNPAVNPVLAGYSYGMQQ